MPTADPLSNLSDEPPVADASPLIILAHGGRLDLLRVLFGRVIVPGMVKREILRPGIPDAAIEALRSLAWLVTVDVEAIPSLIRRFRLDPGEEAVLAWAWAHPGSAAIIDERRGRRAARALGIPVIGTLGIIVEAKARGVIPAARPVVEQLLPTTNWHMSSRLLDQALSRIGE